MQWLQMVDRPRPGWENMAIDCALLDLAAAEGVAFLRLYCWEPFCLSFGRHEPTARRYDRERIRALELDCVRRPTGGRAVWHARELTYAITAPLAAFGGMQPAYRQIHAMLAAAVTTLGAVPELALAQSRSLPTSAGPCFSAPVGGEVLVASRKVVGSAQLRQGEAFLQHGSLLLEDDQSLVRGLAGLADATAPEAALSEILGRTVSFDEAATAVLDSAAALPGGGRLPEAALPPAAVALVAQHASRFRDPAWTWQR
jgi:lipoate-protein ligase A